MTRVLAVDGARFEREKARHRDFRIRFRSPESAFALAIVVMATLWRAWAALQWTFQGDDWAWVSDAARGALLPYMIRQYHGHLQPGQFAVLWSVTKVAPLNYSVAMAPLFLATFVAGVLMWRFLNSLFGERPANLVPLAVFMLCPLTVPPALWLAAGYTIIPLQLFIVATLFVVLRYVRVPSTKHLVAVGLVFGGALLFTEKALLILPLLALFAALFLGEGRGRARLRSLAVGRWRMWGVLAAITVPYVAWYLAVAKWQPTRHATLAEVGKFATNSIGSTVVPTYLGGPWSVSAFGNGVLHQLSPTPRLVTWAVAVVVVAISVAMHRQGWRAWTLPVVYVGLDLALVATGRLGIVGPVIGLAARYYADSVPVFALALGLAFMVPLDRRDDPAWGTRATLPVPDRGSLAVIPTTSLDGLRRWVRTWWTPQVLAGVVVIAYAMSASLTSFDMAATSKTFSPKEWFATVRSQLAAHPTASIVDGLLPANVVPPALLPQAAHASRAFAPIAPHVRWNGPDEHALIFDATGHLRPAVVGTVTAAKPGPMPGCGYLAGPSPAQVPLRHLLFAWTWGIKLAYFTNADADGFVTVDGDRQPVRFLKGLHSLILVHSGTATSLTIEGGGSPICIGGVQVGNLKPSPTA